MRALTGELLLRAWDQGANEHHIRQGWLMLALAMPETSPEQIAELPLSESTLLLLQLHQISFGPLIEAFSTCSGCGAHLEVRIPLAQMIDHQRAAITRGSEEWTEDGRLLRLRPMTGNDLLAALNASISLDAEQSILQRCLQILPQPDDSLAATEPDASWLSAPSSHSSLPERFERINRGAELSCVVECASCSGRATLDLNPAQYLFRLVERGAKRLLREIHELAWAYGWSEEAILRMSAKRRGAYLEMLGA